MYLATFFRIFPYEWKGTEKRYLVIKARTLCSLFSNYELMCCKLTNLDTGEVILVLIYRVTQDDIRSFTVVIIMPLEYKF